MLFVADFIPSIVKYGSKKAELIEYGQSEGRFTEQKGVTGSDGAVRYTAECFMRYVQIPTRADREHRDRAGTGF